MSFSKVPRNHCCSRSAVDDRNPDGDVEVGGYILHRDMGDEEHSCRRYDRIREVDAYPNGEDECCVVHFYQ